MSKEKEMTPELLVMLIQVFKGDPFEELMDICMPETLSLTNRYYLNSYEKDDLIQEAHQILIKASNEFDLSDKGLDFKDYYRLKLQNHLNRLVRAEVAHKRKANSNSTSLDGLVEAGGIHIQGVASPETNPENVTIVREMFADYLDELSEFEQSTFMLFIQGYKTEEIAELLGYGIKQVKNAVYRCSVKLKKALN